MCVAAEMLGVLGGLTSAAGSIAQANAQAKAYEQQAKIAQQNARLAELQGVRELEKGAREEQRFRRQARQFQSTQRSQLAASGSQLAGSNANVLADTAMGIEQDATLLRFNTLQSKYERDVQAVNFRNEASAARANASNAKTAGIFGAFTGLLNTGVQIAGMTAGPVTGADTSSGAIKIVDNNNFGKAYNFGDQYDFNGWGGIKNYDAWRRYKGLYSNSWY